MLHMSCTRKRERRFKEKIDLISDLFPDNITVFGSVFGSQVKMNSKAFVCAPFCDIKPWMGTLFLYQTR